MRPLTLSLLGILALLSGCDTQSPPQGETTTISTLPNAASTAPNSNNSFDTTSSNATSTVPDCPAPQKRYYPKGQSPWAGETDLFVAFPEACYTPCQDASTPCGAGTRCVAVLVDSCQPWPENAPSGTHDDACWAQHSVCLPISKGQACTEIVGTYQDPELKDCGNDSQCNWTIKLLEDGSFEWTHEGKSDIGKYYCHEGTIYVDRGTYPIEKSHYPENAVATFDPATKVIKWGEASYQRSPLP